MTTVQDAARAFAAAHPPPCPMPGPQGLRVGEALVSGSEEQAQAA